MKEGNSERPKQITVFPSSSFTDLEDLESRERFKSLMKLQYGFDDEQLDRDIELLRQQERWKVEANFYLLEVTDCEHEYFGRIGQVMWAMGASFVGNKPSYKVVAEELIKSKAIIEHALCLVVKIDLDLVQLREDGGQYRLIEKFELQNQAIEVRDEDGRVGRLLGWRENDQEGFPFGFYTASFGDEIIEKEDHLMMQEPTWEFRGGISR